MIGRIEIFATLETGAETLHVSAKVDETQDGDQGTVWTRIQTHPAHQDQRYTPHQLMYEAEHWAMNKINDGNILLDAAGWRPDGFGVWRRFAYVHIRED